MNKKLHQKTAADWLESLISQNKLSYRLREDKEKNLSLEPKNKEDKKAYLLKQEQEISNQYPELAEVFANSKNKNIENTTTPVAVYLEKEKTNALDDIQEFPKNLLSPNKEKKFFPFN